jgi:hypothetical protein
MELTASFLKNITSFIGDFSGFSNDTTPDDKCYLNSCAWMCSFKFDRCR